MKTQLSCVVSVVMVFAPFLARQASSASNKLDDEAVQEKAAKKACAMGDYEKGEDILTDLFVATNNVVYIYNQARCYQQNDRWERALSRFREFLRKAEHLTKAQRAETERNIAECEAALRQSPPPGPSPAPATPPRSEPPAPGPATGATAEVQVAPKPVAETNPPKTQPVGNPGRGLRIAGLIFGGVGVGAMGAGVFCTLKTRSITSNEIKHGATKAQEDERKRYETWGWVSYGVGATALAAGVALYILGWTSTESSQVALLPSVNSTGADLLLTGRF
jgi:hypothetical protein